MSEMTPLMKRIAQLKGNMSYAELSEAIYQKTGKKISDKALQHIASGARRSPREKTLRILAEYANKPISWFYEDDYSNKYFFDKINISSSLNNPNIKELIENLALLSPEERRMVEIMIKTLLAAKKEQTAVGE